MYEVTALPRARSRQDFLTIRGCGSPRLLSRTWPGALAPDPFPPAAKGVSVHLAHKLAMLLYHTGWQWLRVPASAIHARDRRVRLRCALQSAALRISSALNNQLCRNPSLLAMAHPIAWSGGAPLHATNI